MGHFEGTGREAPGRIISAFYADAKRYFYGEVKSKKEFEDEFHLGVLEAELKALRKLAGDGTPKGFDDRRFSIEVQLSGDINLSQHPPSAVVLPSI